MAYLLDDGLDEGGQTRIDEVGDNANTLGSASINGLLDETSHILLQHCLHITTLLLILLKDGLATQQSTLLGAIPMELDSISRLSLHNILRMQQSSKNLHDSNRPAPIIVRTRRRQNRREEQVNRVLMRANHDRRVALTGDGGDHRVLLPGMREALSDNSVVRASLLDDRVDLLEDPVRRLQAVVGLVVAGVEASQLLEVGFHVALVEVLGERLDFVVLDALLGELDGALRREVFGAEVGVLGDVHEVLAILEKVNGLMIQD